jgi:c-di-GMP-binding flagellar brake protein YcgR
MAEKRKTKRINEENKVEIKVTKPGSTGDFLTFNALTKDLSLGGARMLVNAPIEVNSELTITLYLTKSHQQPKVDCRVVWVKSINKGSQEIGIEFLHEIPTSVLALINHIYGKDHSIPTIVEPEATVFSR